MTSVKEKVKSVNQLEKELRQSIKDAAEGNILSDTDEIKERILDSQES